jgi:hypothetical protein
MAAHASWGEELTLPVIEAPLEDDDSDNSDDESAFGDIASQTLSLAEQDGDGGAGGGSDDGGAPKALLRKSSSIMHNKSINERKGSKLLLGNGDDNGDDDQGSMVVGQEAEKKKKELPKCRLRVTGLLADRTYDFRVCALNEHGSSDWSLASQRGRTKPPLKPAAPKKLRVDELHPNAVVFGWDEPLFYGAEISDYTVEQLRTARPPNEASEDGDDVGGGGGNDDEEEEEDEARAARQKERNKDMHLFVSTGTGNRRSLRLDDLTTYATYKFRVAATNSVGRSPWSPWTPDIQPTDSDVGDPLEY